MSKNKAKRSKQPATLSAHQRVARNQYAFERGVTSPADGALTLVGEDANGRRTFRVEPTAPIADSKPFNALAMIASLSAMAPVTAARAVATKQLAAEKAIAIGGVVSPDTADHFALITCYKCHCGHATRLFTGFGRVNELSAGAMTIVAVDYHPKHYTNKEVLVSTDACIKCLKLVGREDER